MIPARDRVFGFMELFVNAKTYRKAKRTISEADEDTEHLIVINASSHKFERQDGKYVGRGCGLQVFEKRKRGSLN